MNDLTPMPYECPPEELGDVTGRAATALWVDGNSLSAVAVEARGTGFRLLAAHPLEADTLLERVGRFTHPIFMDAHYLQVDEEHPEFRDLLGWLLSLHDWPRPFVGVYPGGLVSEWRSAGTASRKDQRARLRDGLKASLGSNPYLYPRLFELAEEQDGPTGRTTVWATRFDDAMALASRLTDQAAPFDGLVSGRRAIAQLLRLFEREAPGQPISIVEAGKLWTHYASMHHGRVVLNQAIPIGLARDDQHYYVSLSPTLAGVRRLSDQLGSLLYPPDATPSPIFDPRRSSPQIDSTRFALQVARYATRVESDVMAEFPETPAIVFYLAGRASRVPGMRSYLEAKTGLNFRRFDRRRIPGIELAPGMTWSTAADHLIPLGAAVAYLSSGEDPMGMLLSTRRPVQVSVEQVRALDVAPGGLHIVDRPPWS